jgi:hypothetical protein
MKLASVSLFVVLCIALRAVVNRSRILVGVLGLTYGSITCRDDLVQSLATCTVRGNPPVDNHAHELHSHH